MGECFFWYWHTCVVPDKGPLIGCVRVCVCYYHYYYFFQFLNCQATQPQVFARHPCPVPTPTVQPCHVLSAWECSGCSSFIDYRYKCYSTYFSKCIVTYICGYSRYVCQVRSISDGRKVALCRTQSAVSCRLLPLPVLQ